MLTVAQMFLLDTCVALYVFLMDVELSCFRHRCLLHGAPTSSLCTTAQHGGDAPSWEDTPLCGCQVAPHPLLDPAEVTWEEAESSSWQVNISKPTSGWILTMQHLKLVGSWGSQHSPALDFVEESKLLGLFQWGELWTLVLRCFLEASRWSNWICGQHLTLGCSDPAACYRDTGQSWSAYKAHLQSWNQMIFKACFAPKPFYDFMNHYHEVFYTYFW